MSFVVEFSTKETQKNGVWTEFMGGKFLIAHSSNVKFQRALSRLQSPHRKKIDKGSMDPEVSMKILCRSMAEAIILDWRDIKDPNGVDIQFSVDTCEKVLESMDDLRDYVFEFSSELANYKAELQSDVGNM